MRKSGTVGPRMPLVPFPPKGLSLGFPRAMTMRPSPGNQAEQEGGFTVLAGDGGAE